MASNKKSSPRYDLKAQDRKRDLFIRVGLTALVALFAVGLVLYIVMGSEKKAAAGDTKAVRVAAASLMKKPNTDEPKAVLSIYEDFQCPHCRDFEKAFGSTITKLIDSGAVAVEYYMVALPGLDKSNRGYSTRAANAGYCVGDENKEAFGRFHSALFAQQPEEWAETFPSDNDLISEAKKAGAPDSVTDCVTSGKYLDMVNNAVKSSGISSTPAVLLNGTDIGDAVLLHPDPQALLDQLKTVSG